MANPYTYTKKEEIANAITHGIGVLLSAAALVILIVFSSLYSTPWHIVSFTIYGTTMLILFISSTLVHSFPEGKTKNLFNIFDHSAIYLFIAGTYTPFLLVVIKGTLGWILFGIIWSIAIAGIVFKAYFAHRFLFTSTLFYILMGWLVVIAWNPLSAALPHGGLVLLVTGGILYTLGTIFYVWRGFPFHHAIWHLFVLAGASFHFFAVILYVLPIGV